MTGDRIKVTGDRFRIIGVRRLVTVGRLRRLYLLYKSIWLELFKHGSYYYEILSQCLVHFIFTELVYFLQCLSVCLCVCVLFWYQCFYRHWLRNSVSPVRGIFPFSPEMFFFSHDKYHAFLAAVKWFFCEFFSY